MEKLKRVLPSSVAERVIMSIYSKEYSFVVGMEKCSPGAELAIMDDRLLQMMADVRPMSSLHVRIVGTNHTPESVLSVLQIVGRILDGVNSTASFHDMQLYMPSATADEVARFVNVFDVPELPLTAFDF